MKDTSWIILVLAVTVTVGYLIGYLNMRRNVSGLPVLHWNGQVAPKPWW